MSLPQLQLGKALRTALADATGKPVGLARFPLDTVGEAAQPPFVVLYPLAPSAWQGSPLTDEWDLAELGWQATSVGVRADQALWLADKVRAALIGPSRIARLSVPGAAEVTRRPAGDGGLDEGGETTVSWAERFVFTMTRSG